MEMKRGSAKSAKVRTSSSSPLKYLNSLPKPNLNFFTKSKHPTNSKPSRFLGFLTKAAPSQEVKEEFKFEGFVVIGFFIMILYLFFNNGFFIVAGFFIMLFGFI